MHEFVQRLYFLACSKLETTSSQIKGSTRKIVLLCDGKHKHEIEVNPKVITPILDTNVILERLSLPFYGHCDDSKNHPKLGKYSPGGVGTFVGSTVQGKKLS